MHWAAEQAWLHDGGRNLNIHPKVRVYWMGHRGMRWQGLMPLISRTAARYGPPEVLILQLGENDLVELKGIELVLAAKADIAQLHALYPAMTIGWSYLLPRLRWRGVPNPSRINHAVEKINRAIRNFMRLVGGFTIPHPTIRADAPGIFRDDGVHLTSVGNDIWLRDLRQALLNGN